MHIVVKLSVLIPTVSFVCVWCMTVSVRKGLRRTKSSAHSQEIQANKQALAVADCQSLAYLYVPSSVFDSG